MLNETAFVICTAIYAGKEGISLVFRCLLGFNQGRLFNNPCLEVIAEHEVQSTKLQSVSVSQDAKKAALCNLCYEARAAKIPLKNENGYMIEFVRFNLGFPQKCMRDSFHSRLDRS